MTGQVEQDPNATATTERECWTCKKMLDKSHYYKGDIKKYYNCKMCERARHAARKNKTLKDGEPCCAGCNGDITIYNKTKLYVFGRCDGCKCIWRFKIQKSGKFATGRKQCLMCKVFGCTVETHAIMVNCHKDMYYDLLFKNEGKAHSTLSQTFNDILGE